LSARENLESILSHEEKRIVDSLKGIELVLPLIEIIRSIDYETYFNRFREDQIKSRTVLEKFQFGWSIPFRILYENLDFEAKVPLFEYDFAAREWIDSLIQHGGSIEISRQLIEMCKARLFSLKEKEKTSFVFHQLTHGVGDEYYEKLSMAYYHSVVEKILKEKINETLIELPVIKEELKSIVDISNNHFIEYKATVKVEAFYRKLGYIMMMTSQIVDDIDESDMFGGIPYKNYLDVVEYGFMASLMHRDCCFSLAEKAPDQVSLRTIFTYHFSFSQFIELLSDYFGWENGKTLQIVSCLTISKENFEYHLSYPGLGPSPYFQISKDVLMRSLNGCQSKPVFFLNRELHRKYPKDFRIARNRRESRFKAQLYDLFQQNQLQCIDQNININTTDIDAVVFDKKKKILALFQLKWQDSFSTSMKERRSRISNMIPKAVRWIDKVEEWIKGNDNKAILNACGIDGNRIEDIHLIVLSRNHVHFTNVELDQRATWGSWFQLIEASAKVKSESESNPILEMVTKLRFYYPEMRREVEGLIVGNAREITFSNCKVRINS